MTTSQSNLSKSGQSKQSSTITGTPKVETPKAGSKTSISSPTSKPAPSSSSKNLNLSNKSGVETKGTNSGNTTARGTKPKTGTSSTIKSRPSINSSKQLVK